MSNKNNIKDTGLSTAEKSFHTVLKKSHNYLPSLLDTLKSVFINIMVAKDSNMLGLPRPSTVAFNPSRSIVTRSSPRADISTVSPDGNVTVRVTFKAEQPESSKIKSMVAMVFIRPDHRL